MSLTLLTALLLQSMPAPGAAQWENVGAPRGGIAFAVDPTSIARTGDRVTSGCARCATRRTTRASRRR